MNSSAIRRLSTFSQNGKLPSVLRTPGSEVTPPAEREVLVECVVQVAREHDLGALTLVRVGAPGVEKVAKLGIEQPAEKLDLHLQELYFLATVNGSSSDRSKA